MNAMKTPVHGEYLTFSLGEEDYGIELLRVREIIRYEPVTYVPMALPFIRGVINLRGSVVPVVDLAIIFQLTPRAVDRATCIVITDARLDGEEVVMGVVADRVNQVLEFSSDDIEPAPSLGTAIQVKYLLGLGKSGQKFVLLLDIDRVLSTTELQMTAALPEQLAAEVDQTSQPPIVQGGKGAEASKAEVSSRQKAPGEQKKPGVRANGKQKAPHEKPSPRKSSARRVTEKKDSEKKDS
jgi:purine-binding chemotaxis protein CheW